MPPNDVITRDGEGEEIWRSVRDIAPPALHQLWRSVACQPHEPMEFTRKWRQRVPSMRMNKFIIQHGVITHSDIICIRLHLDRDQKIVSELSSLKN